MFSSILEPKLKVYKTVRNKYDTVLPLSEFHWLANINESIYICDDNNQLYFDNKYEITDYIRLSSTTFIETVTGIIYDINKQIVGKFNLHTNVIMYVVDPNTIFYYGNYYEFNNVNRIGTIFTQADLYNHISCYEGYVTLYYDTHFICHNIRSGYYEKNFIEYIYDPLNHLLYCYIDDGWLVYSTLIEWKEGPLRYIHNDEDIAFHLIHQGNLIQYIPGMSQQIKIHYSDGNVDEIYANEIIDVVSVDHVLVVITQNDIIFIK